MKISVKTLLASLFTAVVLSSSAFTSMAAAQSSSASTIVTGIAFNKVVVTGNVKVELVQADRQKVEVVEDYNKALTSIVQKGDKLFIDSKEAEPLHVIVYVKDLHRIQASNTVAVTTRGKFSADVMQVFLQDKATAFVNGNIGSLYTVVKGNAELKLKGSSRDHVSVKSKVARLKTTQFAALKTTTTSLEGDVLKPEYAMELSKDSILQRRTSGK